MFAFGSHSGRFAGAPASDGLGQKHALLLGLLLSLEDWMFRMGAFFALAFFLTASGCAFAQSPETAKAIGAANAPVARLYDDDKHADALALALQTVERAGKDLGEVHPDNVLLIRLGLLDPAQEL